MRATGVRILAALAALLSVALPATAADVIDPDEAPSLTISQWISESAREWVLADPDRPEAIGAESVSFQTPRRALVWSPLLFSRDDDEPVDLWATERAEEVGPLRPPRYEAPGSSMPRPPRHPEALPAGTDPVQAGLVIAADAWWIPVTVNDEGVGVIEVSFERSSMSVISTWSPDVATELLRAPHSVVRDPNGWIGVALPNVRALDEYASERIAGPVPIETYLDVLIESATERQASSAEQYSPTAPILITLASLALLGVALAVAAWLRSEERE